MISAALASAALGWTYRDFVPPPASQLATLPPKVEIVPTVARAESYPPQPLPPEYQPIVPAKPKPQPKTEPKAKRIAAYWTQAIDGTVWTHNDPAYLQAWINQHNAELAGWPPATCSLNQFCQ